jgi:hypothetical protein
MSGIVIKKHLIKGICQAKYCNNKCVGKLCSTHRSQKCRESDPVRYSYNNLRNNSKRRNIPCTITLDEYREFCTGVKYIGFSGRASESLTIDRKKNWLGYTKDNIQVMKKGLNVKKYFYYDWQFKTVRFEVGEVVDGPF